MPGLHSTETQGAPWPNMLFTFWYAALDPSCNNMKTLRSDRGFSVRPLLTCWVVLGCWELSTPKSRTDFCCFLPLAKYTEKIPPDAKENPKREKWLAQKKGLRTKNGITAIFFANIPNRPCRIPIFLKKAHQPALFACLVTSPAFLHLETPRSSRLKQRPVTDLVRIIFNRLANVDSSQSFGAAEMAPENRTSYHGSYRKCLVRSETQKILTLCPKMTWASFAEDFWLAHIIQRLL